MTKFKIAVPSHFIRGAKPVVSAANEVANGAEQERILCQLFAMPGILC
jgi:hypothetical protein